jgi:hypothetical protein
MLADLPQAAARPTPGAAEPSAAEVQAAISRTFTATTMDGSASVLDALVDGFDAGVDDAAAAAALPRATRGRARAPDPAPNAGSLATLLDELGVSPKQASALPAGADVPLSEAELRDLRRLMQEMRDAGAAPDEVARLFQDATAEAAGRVAATEAAPRRAPHATAAAATAAPAATGPSRATTPERGAAPRRGTAPSSKAAAKWEALGSDGEPPGAGLYRDGRPGLVRRPRYRRAGSAPRAPKGPER